MSTDLIAQEVFQDAVIADVRGEATPQQSQALADNVSLWITQLVTLLRDVEIQFSARKAQSAKRKLASYTNNDEHSWLVQQSVDNEWKLKTNRFRASIEARLRYAKSLRAKSN